jgi:hypothetical protein
MDSRAHRKTQPMVVQQVRVCLCISRGRREGGGLVVGAHTRRPFLSGGWPRAGCSPRGGSPLSVTSCLLVGGRWAATATHVVYDWRRWRSRWRAHGAGWWQMAWVAGGLWVGDYIFETRLKEINVEIEEINAVRRCAHPHARPRGAYDWFRLSSRLCKDQYVTVKDSKRWQAATTRARPN